MKIAAIFGPREGGICEVPDPRPRGRYVVVKVTVAAMCIEYKLYQQGNVHGSHTALGHEGVGEVVATDCAEKVHVGDRVIIHPFNACGRCAVCQSGNSVYCQNMQDVLNETGNTSGIGTMAQYVVKHEDCLTKLPSEISDDHAVMAHCALGMNFGAMQAMQVSANDSLLVSGLGPVGLGCVINGRYRGAQVIAVDGNPYRAGLAIKLGADYVIDPRNDDASCQVLRHTDLLGATASVETSGFPDAKRLLLDGTRPCGRVALVGWSGELDVNTIIAKGLTIYGIWYYNLNDASLLLQMIANTGPQLDILITHRYPMSRLKDAWETQLTGKCGKVLLYPWQ